MNNSKKGIVCGIVLGAIITAECLTLDGHHIPEHTPERGGFSNDFPTGRQTETISSISGALTSAAADSDHTFTLPQWPIRG
jgi:hypothetical protein